MDIFEFLDALKELKPGDSIEIDGTNSSIKLLPRISIGISGNYFNDIIRLSSKYGMAGATLTKTNEGILINRNKQP